MMETNPYAIAKQGLAHQQEPRGMTGDDWSARAEDIARRRLTPALTARFASALEAKE